MPLTRCIIYGLVVPNPAYIETHRTSHAYLQNSLSCKYMKLPICTYAKYTKGMHARQTKPKKVYMQTFKPCAYAYKRHTLPVISPCINSLLRRRHPHNHWQPDPIIRSLHAIACSYSFQLVIYLLGSFLPGSHTHPLCTDFTTRFIFRATLFSWMATFCATPAYGSMGACIDCIGIPAYMHMRAWLYGIMSVGGWRYKCISIGMSAWMFGWTNIGYRIVWTCGCVGCHWHLCACTTLTRNTRTNANPKSSFEGCVNPDDIGYIDQLYMLADVSMVRASASRSVGCSVD